MYGWMSAVIWKTADGTKLRTAHKKQKVKNRLGGGIINWSPDTTEYIGDLILKNSHPVMLQFDGGYASFNTSGAVDGCHYYIQDYMGNNRMVVNGNGDIEQVTHYYPYGGVIGDISTNENFQKYKFEGKEYFKINGVIYRADCCYIDNNNVVHIIEVKAGMTPGLTTNQQTAIPALLNGGNVKKPPL